MIWALVALNGFVTVVLVFGAGWAVKQFRELASHLVALNERLREDNQHLAQAKNTSEYRHVLTSTRRPDPVTLIERDHRPPREPRIHDDRRDPPVPVGVGANA